MKYIKYGIYFKANVRTVYFILPHHKLGEISTLDVDTFYNQALENGLSPKTIRIMHSLLRKAFEQALKWQMLQHNPIVQATPPRIEESERDTWNQHQINAFLNVAQQEGLEIPFFIAIFTGMRRGEVLGLKWADVDLLHGKIHIRRALYCINNELKYKNPKTSGSKRQISISSNVIKG